MPQSAAAYQQFAAPRPTHVHGAAAGAGGDAAGPLPQPRDRGELAQLRAHVATLEADKARLWERLAARTQAEEELRVLLLNTQRLLTGPAQDVATAPETPENTPVAGEPSLTLRRRRFAFWRR